MDEKFTGLTEEQKRILGIIEHPPKNKRYIELKTEFEKYGIALYDLGKFTFLSFEDAEKILGVLQGYNVVLSKGGTTLKMIKKEK